MRWVVVCGFLDLYQVHLKETGWTQNREIVTLQCLTTIDLIKTIGKNISK